MRRDRVQAQGWVKPGPGEEVEARAALLDLGGAGDTVWHGARDQVQPGAFVRELQEARRPGCGLGERAGGELPGALPREERCSGTPDPRGKPTCSERPGQGSRVTGDRPSGSCPSKGRTALRTAAAEGQKSTRPGHSWRPTPSARLAELRNANPHQPNRGFAAGPASLACDYSSGAQDQYILVYSI